MWRFLSNYHFSSAPSILRSGMFGIFLFKYADDILSSAWKVCPYHNYKEWIKNEYYKYFLKISEHIKHV